MVELIVWKGSSWKKHFTDIIQCQIKKKTKVMTFFTEIGMYMASNFHMQPEKTIDS